MKIITTEFDIVGTLLNNGSAVGGGGTTNITNKSLNTGSTTDIAEIALPDNGQIGLFIAALMYQDDGATNKDITCADYSVLATADSSGNMYVGANSVNEVEAGTLGNAFIEITFVADEANNKVTLRVTHTEGAYTPTTLKANFIITSLDGTTITVL